MNLKESALKINPETEKTGVFGFPVKHSASPAMQNAAFIHAGLNYIYLSFEIKPENIGEALNSLNVLGFRGINLTMPHKENCLPFLDEISPEAEKIKAVNTVSIASGKLTGHNTDIEGFLRPLVSDSGWMPEGKKAVLLGAGGAARAVAFSLLNAGAAEITIANRTAARAESLAGFMENLFPGSGIKHAPLGGDSLAAEISSCSLLVNCTPLGMKGESPLEDVSCIGPGLMVYDLIYKPSETPLMASARKRGAAAIGGLGMLVYQGAASFKIWTAAEPPVEVMREACAGAVGVTLKS